MAGALEVHAAGLDDALFAGMSFTNRNTASYVTGRRSTAFQPVSGGVFAPSNLRIMRFSMQDCDGQWLDGSTLRLAFVLANTGTQTLTPNTNSPASMFARLRVLAGGVEVTDIAEYGRTHQMFSNLLPAARRTEDAIEGWGAIYATTDGLPLTVLSQNFSPAPLAAGKKRRVLTQLLCPFFNNGKMLPLSLLGGITVELQLGDINDAFNKPLSGQVNSWEIQSAELLCDCLSLDPSLSSSFASHLLAGKTLPISYSNFFTFQTSITTASSVNIPCTRGFSRLNAVYITFTSKDSLGVSDFYSPLNGNSPTTDVDTFRASFQLGSMKQPTYDIRSIGECFYHLRKTLIMADGSESMGITFPEYSDNKFVLAFSFEKALGTGAVHSGANTLAGQLLYIMMQYCGDATTAHVVCHYDCVLSATSGGNELAF